MMKDINQSIEGNNNIQAVFQEKVGNLASVLAGIMPQIANLVDSAKDDVNDVTPYEIEQKIQYNKIYAYKEIIDAYGQYGTRIDEIYNEYNNGKPGSKKKIFNYFRAKYRLKKAELLSENATGDPTEVVKNNSDKIIAAISKAFLDDLKVAKNLEIDIEDLETCVLAITCHAFIECKILEKPTL